MSRIEVLKTYKIYIGGKFPRTESGRYYQPQSNGMVLGNICQSSRKDFRNAVVVARSAQGGWSSKSAYNRSQILYRVAEILEGRRVQFINELVQQGSKRPQAEKEVNLSIDRLIYFAGWCDKYTQIFSSVNPVASSHFNFSVPEPTGVVAILAPEESGLLGLISQIAPTIAGGNTCVVLASENKPLCSVTLAEVLSTSDVPGGVINILTGNRKELIPHFASHMDVNALVYCGDNAAEIKTIHEAAVDNLKRVKIRDGGGYVNDKYENPYLISSLQETKTTWHPIEKIGAAGSGY
jgi:acyl-CoA reductase-like NAD-dependent aldehyde dehydrogenase